MKAVVYRANFAGANLSDTLFDRAVLNEADLTGAILQRAVLTRSDLGGAKITGAGGRDGGERRGLADPARARPWVADRSVRFWAASYTQKSTVRFAWL